MLSFISNFRVIPKPKVMIAMLFAAFIMMAAPIPASAQLSTITALSSSANSAKFNQPITFTATVSSSGTTPTGTVTFGDTAITYGTSILSNGQATLTVNTLSAGFHSVTAIYNGSASFAASVSPVLAQDIMSAKLFLSLAHVSQQPSTDLTAVGGDLTYDITANNQDVALSNVVIMAVLSGRYAVASAISSKGSCSGGAPVVCTINSVNSGEVVNITLHITPLLTRMVGAHLAANATVNTANDSAAVRLRPFVH